MSQTSWNRREMIAASTAASLALATATAADEKKGGYIDAHSHIWPGEVDRYPLAAGQTKADLKPPSFTDDELMKIASPEGIERVVLIQHSVYHLFDNSYLIDAVKRHPERFRIVGMVDDHKPHAGEAMKGLLKQGVTGFRITPFIRKDHPEKWLDSAGMQEMWKTGAETRQAMCCLISASDIPGVDQMCRKHSDTPVVIDHFARIGYDGELRDSEIKSLCDLSRHKHVSVKISAYYALGKKKPPHDELIPVIKRLLEAYGPQRLMWASDSPYQLEPPNTYASSISLVRDRLDVSDDDRQWLLRKTAEKVFFYV
jgi:predicted TIM-barrel fold metal-dependent hydrolase